MRGRALLAAAVLVLLAGCDDDASESAAASSTRVAPAPLDPIPAGAVPRGWLDRQADLDRPPPGGPLLVARGRERYGIFCAPCHGAAGGGDGVVTRHGLVPPLSFHAPALREMTEAEIVAVITRGRGRMLPYAERIEPRDRWAVAAYVKALQREEAAPAGSAIYGPDAGAARP